VHTTYSAGSEGNHEAREGLTEACCGLCAGRVNPEKVAAIAAVMRCPAARAGAWLRRCPAEVQLLHPQAVASRLRDLCDLLGLRPRRAALMVAKQPAFYLLTSLADVEMRATQLAALLEVERAAVVRAAASVPSLLARDPAVIQRRVVAYSQLLQCRAVDVLHVMARGPEYLTDTPSSVSARMTALGAVLRRPRCTIAAMLQARPDLASLSAKVMNTKVNGLMSILGKEKRHVVTLVVKRPDLLRCDLDRSRAVFAGLQQLLHKREGFAYAMVCHAPQLLLLTLRSVHQRCAALRRCLAASADWQAQFAQLRPPHVAQLLLNRQGSLSVLMYLADRHGGRGPVLAELLACTGQQAGATAVLGSSAQDFHAWAQRRRRAQLQLLHQLRQRQRAGALAASAAVSAGRAGPAQGGLVQAAARLLRPGAAEEQPGRDSQARSVPPLSAAHGASLADAAVSAHAGDEASRGSLAGRDGAASLSQAPQAAAQPHGIPAGGPALADGSAQRCQQPGASTSGRLPSWLQLVARGRRLQPHQGASARQGDSPALEGNSGSTQPGLGRKAGQLVPRDSLDAQLAAVGTGRPAGRGGTGARPHLQPAEALPGVASPSEDRGAPCSDSPGPSLVVIAGRRRGRRSGGVSAGRTHVRHSEPGLAREQHLVGPVLDRAGLGSHQPGAALANGHGSRPPSSAEGGPPAADVLHSAYISAAPMSAPLLASADVRRVALMQHAPAGLSHAMGHAASDWSGSPAPSEPIEAVASHAVVLRGAARAAAQSHAVGGQAPRSEHDDSFGDGHSSAQQVEAQPGEDGAPPEEGVLVVGGDGSLHELHAVARTRSLPRRVGQGQQRPADVQRLAHVGAVADRAQAPR
jgi:hypothetical protein